MSLFNQIPGTINTPDNDNIYYQFLLVSPCTEIKGKYIKTKLVANTKEELKTKLLDQKTIDNLSTYYPQNFTLIADSKGEKKTKDSIGSYLPSPGVIFPPGFLEALLAENNLSIDPNVQGKTIDVIKYTTPLNNLYEPIQTLLQTRKISQLIARTWYAYLTAKKDKHQSWKNFIKGHWHQVNTNILDGLIAREIFFFDEKYAPDELESKNQDIYNPLFSTSTEQSQDLKFLIPPSSRGWQGIALSLLLSGQVYYESKECGQTRYHQVHPPILSTGDVVFRYGIEVNWNSFKGTIKEMQLSPGKDSIASQATVPYPPIPYKVNLSRHQIEEWAYAEDENGDIPFFVKDKDGQYSLNVQYFAPPYPYLPLSTC